MEILTTKDGQYIRWEDYARLKAEVHRLNEIIGSDAIDRKYGMCCDASDENARLKAEVEARQSWNNVLAIKCDGLKAEVERLKAEPDALTAYLYADTLRRDDIKTLKAQVERLTKAGDVMAIMLQHDEVSKDWNAAKEGKQ